jgi:serine/threonine protein kinase
MPNVKEANAEPIAGYRLIEPLGSGGFGEVWKCEAPGGIYKAIKFVYGDLNGLDADSARAAEELRAVQHIKAIRHPFLLSMDRVESIDGELVIVMELADQNLQELLARYQQSGRAGIPRGELLRYLHEAAEVLDLMHQEHRLQHLDIKPRNLFLVSHHVKVADFGLVNSLAGGHDHSKIQLGAITPLYAAPELFLGSFSRHSDQYSLAIVYQELLTGVLPFTGKNCRQLLFQHTKVEPGLHLLPAADREVVARALAKDADKRFASCLEFVDALRCDPLSATIPVGNDAAPQTDPTDKATPATVAAPGSAGPCSGPPVSADILPGYRFLECLGRSPLVDQWRVEAPDGRQRLAKILYGHITGERLKSAMERLRALRHPGLVDTTVISADPGRLVLVTDLAEETLRDRATACQARKFPGIMRGELLEYFRSAAEVLDYLYHQHSIQHLSLNPRNLVVLSDGRLQIADFGLAQLLWLPTGQSLAERNARYAAPELFQQQLSPSSDQYSLALIYHEMLTGVHAFRGPAKTQATVRTQIKPDLKLLPEPDREVIARALAVDPAGRWPSCRAMVSALDGVPVDEPQNSEEDSDRFAALLAASRAGPITAAPVASQQNLDGLIAELLSSLGGERAQAAAQEAPTLSAAGNLLQHKFQAGLPLGSARLKLEAFSQIWYAPLVHEDEHGCVFHLNLPTNFWKQWLARQPGLEIRVHMARVHALSATPIDINVEVRPVRCNKKRGSQLLQEMGLTLIDSIRSQLLIGSEKRMQDRLLWPHPVKVCPLFADGTRGETIECPGKDISQTGIGFYLPEELETSEVLIHLPNAIHPPAISVPARLVRAKRCADGWYEVGALFRLPALRKALPGLCASDAAR